MRNRQFIIALVLLSFASGGVGGYVASMITSDRQRGFSIAPYTANTIDDIDNQSIVHAKEESAIIHTVESASPAVVSIVVTKDVPRLRTYSSDPFRDEFFRQFFGDDFESPYDDAPSENNTRGGTERREIGGGSGFLITADGYIVTNKHVVSEANADYTVFLNDERKFDAHVVALDTINDIAILKIDAAKLPVVPLGDSANLKVGQSVIAIGNALGEFRNTVSTGVISGLARSVTPSGPNGDAEILNDVIQTDASINPGNSGGPLLNIAGQVIGINTAIVYGAQNIGFAIPINEAKKIISDVRAHGRIIRPWLGVRYILINASIADENNLDVDYGALVVRGESRGELAVSPGSPADKAGIEENDIILEINGKQINEKNPLARALAKFEPGNNITLKIRREGKDREMKITLEERKSVR